jgi:hypothetical protein
MRVKGSGVKALTIFVLLVCLLLTGCTDSDDGEDNTGEDLIKKVEISPENPTADDTVRIELFLNEPYKHFRPNFQVISLFKINEELDNVLGMEKENDKEFYIEVGPFKPTDQIWFMIYLFIDNDVVVYNDTIDIGSVEYSQDLNIDVTYSEEDFMNLTSSNITADIYYSEALQGIRIQYYRIKLNPVNNQREGVYRNCTPVNWREQIGPGHEQVVMPETNIEADCTYLARFVLYNSTKLFSTPTIQIET